MEAHDGGVSGAKLRWQSGSRHHPLQVLLGNLRVSLSGWQAAYFLEGGGGKKTLTTISPIPL